MSRQWGHRYLSLRHPEGARQSRASKDLAGATARGATQTLRGAASRRAPQGDGRQRFSSSELATTETEDAAIAAPAIAGVISPIAARGMPITLKMKAQNR